MQQTIVALALAMLNTETGSMHQADKDFFDAHVADVDHLDLQEAVTQLVSKRLQQFVVSL